MSFPWSLHTKVDDLDSIYCLAGRWLHEMLTFSYSVCARRIKAAGGLSDDSKMLYFPPGRLAFKEEGAGKVRVFAIPNAVKQALLRPAHDWLVYEDLASHPM